MYNICKLMSNKCKLTTSPPFGDDECRRRSSPWAGYHTEYCDIDVKH